MYLCVGLCKYGATLKCVQSLILDVIERLVMWKQKDDVSPKLGVKVVADTTVKKLFSKL